MRSLRRRNLEGRARVGARRALAWTVLAVLGSCGPPPEATVDPDVVRRPLPGPADPVDTALVRAGAFHVQRRCVACHGLDGGTQLVGPDLGGVTLRRDTAWLRGMIRRPDSMLAHDSIAQRLLEEYAVPMLDTETDEARFRAIYEFLRARDRG